MAREHLAVDQLATKVPGPLMSCPLGKQRVMMLQYHLLWGLLLVPSHLARDIHKTGAAGEILDILPFQLQESVSWYKDY